MNNGLPQAGIITSLNATERRAKIFLPLFKIETNWIPVASNLLYDTTVGLQQVGLDAIGASEVQAGPGEVDGASFTAWEATAASASSAAAAAGSVSRINYGSLQVGDEVAVIFLNGDINQGRVIARF